MTLTVDHQLDRMLEGLGLKIERPNAEEFAGYHPFRDDEGNEHGSFQVFYAADDQADEPGWYWWACFPGCMPDSDSPTGPFPTSEGAYLDAIGD